MSKIEWTEKTWNPTIGCTEVSPGCTHCYAARMAFRLSHIPAMAEDYAGLTKKLPNGRIVWTGVVKTLPDRLQEILQVKKPTVWFVDSMSDLFHKDVPFEFIYKVFQMMFHASWHTFQVLTKRAERLTILDDVYLHLKRNFPDANFPLKNVWVGVSVENQKAADERIPYLVKAPAAIRFLSCEPLLGPIEFSNVTKRSDAVSQLGKKALNGIHWVIAGGESGNGARPMHPSWVRSLRNQCDHADVPFFFKQWGEYVSVSEVAGPGNHYVFPDGATVRKTGKKLAGRTLDGVTHDGLPT